MKKLLALLFSAGSIVAVAQDLAPAAPYYNNFNWNLVGTPLKNALATKITTTHTKELTYGQLWDALPLTDRPAHSGALVTLFYGWEAGTDNDITNDLYRDADNHGGNQGQWNREHVFLQSKGNPVIGQSGAGSDAHHLRPADVDRNGARGDKKFVSIASTSIPSYAASNQTWYPGDEWKGDVARILMYLYLRYGNQCLPTEMVATSATADDVNMPMLLLQWNAEDPVSPLEDRRNSVMNSSNFYAQGNRNPFIDNPYLATLIWGGPVAQNRWPFMSAQDFAWEQSVTVYPIPSYNEPLNVTTTLDLDKISIYNAAGQLIYEINNPSHEQQIHNLPKGFYLMKIDKGTDSTVKKILVN